MSVSSAIANYGSQFLDGLEECGDGLLDMIKKQGSFWEFNFRTASCLPQNKYFVRPLYKFLAAKFGNNAATVEPIPVKSFSRIFGSFEPIFTCQSKDNIRQIDIILALASENRPK